jgi:TolB protein
MISTAVEGITDGQRRAPHPVYHGLRGRRLAAIVALVAWASSGAGPLADRAAAQVTGEIIGPGATAYPIAVSPLREIGGQQDDAPVRFAEVLSRDLALSGYFRVLDRAAYIEDPQTSGTTADQIEFRNWSVIGALALVKGTLERRGEDLTVEVRVFDVAGGRALAAKRYRAPPSKLARIAHRFADEILGAFTGTLGPFDSQIAFISTRDGGTKDLYVMAFDDELPIRVTNHRSIVISPAWSSDGSRVLFTSYRDGRPGVFDVDLTRRRWRRLVRGGSLSAGGAWSPDGSLLALTREIGDNPEIVSIRPGDKVGRQLTSHPAIDVSPSWAPDGRQIAFCSDRAGGPQIFVADVTSGHVRRVTYRGAYNTSPAWSPLGNEIAYTGRVGGRFQIFAVDASGGYGERLTNDPGDNEDPSWSPDGRYLVFSSTRTGRAHLFMLHRKRGSQTQLTRGEGNDTSPAWSPRLK